MRVRETSFSVAFGSSWIKMAVCDVSLRLSKIRIRTLPNDRVAGTLLSPYVSAAMTTILHTAEPRGLVEKTAPERYVPPPRPPPVGLSRGEPSGARRRVARAPKEPQ